MLHIRVCDCLLACYFPELTISSMYELFILPPVADSIGRNHTNRNDNENTGQKPRELVLKSAISFKGLEGGLTVVIDSPLSALIFS